MNYLDNNFYTNPRHAFTTLTRPQLRETLLHLSGYVLACGKLWDVKSKHLGAGVYKVWLKEQK